MERTIFVNMILFLIVVVGIASWVIFMQSKYEVSNKLADDSRFNAVFSSLNSSLASTNNEAKTQEDSFNKDRGFVGAVTDIIFTSLKSIINNLGGQRITSIWNSLGESLKDAVGVSPAIILGFSAIITISLILLIVAIIKIGR